MVVMPPAPPLDLILRASPRHFLRPSKRGEKSDTDLPLRCKVQGGWGGSAHYPDPTAQSVAAALRPSLAVRQDVVVVVPDPLGPAVER